MAITFRNTVYGAGFVGTDDGAPSAGFGIDDVSTSNIIVNGTVNQTGDTVQATGIFPTESVSTTKTLYATQYDSQSAIQFTDSTTSPTTRYVFSNTVLAARQRVTFDTNNTPSDYVPVCYAAGTLIRTVRGDVPVENLSVGDHVVTASGEARPIRWLGHRTLDCTRHPRPDDIQPVRIHAHAFGENRPTRDLVVSPGHAICIDLLGEVLVPASVLVNGATIVREMVSTITYWHVELDSHDILLAEGLPAESYLDMGNRGFFPESDVVGLGLGPDAPTAQRTHADFCRPFHESGTLIDAARNQLRRRAETLGWCLETPEPFAGAHLVVDGRVVQPDHLGLSACFLLPASAREVWLVSPTSAPRDAAINMDTRELGLFLCRISLDDGLQPAREIALDDPLLCAGFHAAEPDHRWTAGRARLPAALWGGLVGTVRLRLDLRGPSLPHWVAPAIAASSEALAA